MRLAIIRLALPALLGMPLGSPQADAHAGRTDRGRPVAASQSPESPELELARRWLAGLKTGQPARIRDLTALPFRFATTQRSKRCEGPVETQAALGAWVQCLKKAEPFLFAELNAGDEGALREGLDAETDELRDLARSIAPGGSWLAASLEGASTSFSFRFLVVKSPGTAARIGAFLLKVESSTG